MVSSKEKSKEVDKNKKNTKKNKDKKEKLDKKEKKDKKEKPKEKEIKSDSKSKEAKKSQPVKEQAPISQTSKTKKSNLVALLNVYSSKNDTIITATDLTGSETLAWASGGMMVKSHREEGRPYAAMQATNKVMTILKNKGIFMVKIRIRGPGGNKAKTPASGAQAVVRTVARSGVRVLKIEDVTPLPTDSMKRRGGRRGRRI